MDQKKIKKMFHEDSCFCAFSYMVIEEKEQIVSVFDGRYVKGGQCFSFNLWTVEERTPHIHG